MKTRYLIFSVLFFIAAMDVASQSLQNNEYYRKSVEFSKLSETALNEGEYDLAKDYAVKSQEYSVLSKGYIAERLAAYKAYSSLKAAGARIEAADRIGFKSVDPVVYGEALDAFNASKSFFESKDYEKSLENSKKVLELLSDMKAASAAAASSEKRLPEYYVVRLLPGNRDCLWNISGYDFVYNDPTKWPRLYKENKKSFRYPDNPDLIYPGQVLKIPSINGEKREGFYNYEDKAKYNYKY